MLWHWTAEDQKDWDDNRAGVEELFSKWVEIAVAAAEEDHQLLDANLPEEFRTVEWFRSHLERHRSTFCGSPLDPETRESARRVGFAHISAQVAPSIYVGLYNLMFSAYHALEANNETSSMPRLSTIRGRWLYDMQTELDTYNVALNGLIDSMNALVLIDPLTGTLNRRGLWERIVKDIEGEVAEACLVVLDIDSFKAINDQYGHPTGDSILVKLATLAKTLSRPGDAIGRIGGDEFIWWVPSLRDQSILGRRLQDLSTRLSTEESLTFSAGISHYPIDGKTVEELYTLADEAMYRAKHAGRQRWCIAGVDEIYAFL